MIGSQCSVHKMCPNLFALVRTKAVTLFSWSLFMHLMYIKNEREREGKCNLELMSMLRQLALNYNANTKCIVLLTGYLPGSTN